MIKLYFYYMFKNLKRELLRLGKITLLTAVVMGFTIFSVELLLNYVSLPTALICTLGIVMVIAGLYWLHKEILADVEWHQWDAIPEDDYEDEPK